MKDTYHNHVEDKAENISMLINELSNIRHENISLMVIDNAVEKICDILVGSALDVFGKKPIYTNVNIRRGNTVKKPWFTYDCKIARRNFRRAKRLYKNLEDIFLKKICMKKKDYIRKN